MKRKIHELKMKFYEWRKRIIEEKYFKAFPLDELKGWLSEVAENNYSNSLEYGCNELIRRINEGGFERYVRGELG